MSSASSEQSCVRERAGYDEAYPLGQDDPGTCSEEKVPSANSPSTKDDDLDGDGSESDSNEDIGNDEPPDSNRNWKSRYFFTLVTKNTCPWTKPGALCPHPVCIHLYEVRTLIFFDILTVSYCSSEPSTSHT